MVKEELCITSVSLSPSLQMKNDDEQTHSYTGLPSYSTFTTLLPLWSTVIPPYDQCRICEGNQFLMVLMKLRQAVINQDLGYRFRLVCLRFSISGLTQQLHS